MFHAKHGTFAMMVNFINDEWELVHILVGIFEVQNISGATMAIYVEMLLYSIGLLNKVIMYVKDKGCNTTTSSYVK
jgi:hypothetical protein